MTCKNTFIYDMRRYSYDIWIADMTLQFVVIILELFAITCLLFKHHINTFANHKWKHFHLNNSARQIFKAPELLKLCYFLNTWIQFRIKLSNVWLKNMNRDIIIVNYGFKCNQQRLFISWIKAPLQRVRLS